MSAIVEPGAGPAENRLWRVRAAWLAMDRNPSAIAFARSWRGIALIHIAFVATLLAGAQISAVATVMVAAVLVGCALLPAYRLAVMAWGGLAYICLRPFRTQQQADFAEQMSLLGVESGQFATLAFQVPMVLLFLLLAYGMMLLQRRRPTSLLGRRPLLCQMIALAVLILGGLALTPGTWAHSILWMQVTILAASFFFLAYAFADNRTRDATPTVQRLGFLRPFWAGPSVPFKSPAFLKKFEAADADQLAALQLRALKLGIWALLLALAHRLCSALFYDVAALPTLDGAIGAIAAGEALHPGLSWTVVAKNFVLNILGFGALAHTLVAIVRMCGYGIPRHMARPLSARTVAEFWNRYVYYFKEVLVDFFFYPAFVRWFKKSPKLRIAFATFCAACVGNLLFSMIAQAHLFATVGPLAALATFQSYAVYALALATALIVSQLRAARPKPEDGALRYHVLPRVNVLLFFALAQIFADEIGAIGLGERTDFLLHLFGV
ncbi:MAG: hypothetical protein AB7I52_04515 [Rhizobiaceae bacterium]